MWWKGFAIDGGIGVERGEIRLNSDCFIASRNTPTPFRYKVGSVETAHVGAFSLPEFSDVV